MRIGLTRLDFDYSALRRLACGGLLCALAASACAMELPKGDTLAVTDSWGMDKGLPQAGVTAVIQTRDDYLWVGTDGGLARFDGMKFTTFRSTNTPALNSHSVTKLFEDRAHTLWIGTENGLVSYRQGVFELAGLAGRTISAIAEDAEGDLWLGTDNGLSRRHGDELETFPADPVLPRTAAQAILADTSGRIWIGFAGWTGVACFQNGRFERVDSGDALRGEVVAMAEAPRGTLWFATTNGLVRLKDGAFTRFGTDDGLASRRIAALHVDMSGELWVASSALQKIHRDDLKDIVTVTQVSGRILQSLCRDREGNVWVGTAGEGLMRVQAASFQLIGLNARTTANGFRTVMQDNSGVVWLAQGTLGYTRIASETDVRRAMPGAGTEAGEILAIYSSRRGDLWTGGRDALRHTHDGKTESHPEFAGMRAMFEDRQGRMWLGRQNGGFVRWQNGVFKTIPLPESVALCTPSSFAETSTGEIWVGTWLHGLLRLRDDEVKAIGVEAGLPTVEMRSVFVDRDDNVWVGTKGRGLAVLDGDRWLVPEWTSELIDQQIISLVDDQSDNLWLAAPRGVFMAARKELLEAMRGQLPLKQLRLVNAAEGLHPGVSDLSCFPNAWRTQRGDLWFATRRGILRIDPTQTRINPLSPTVHLERVLVNGQRQPITDEIVLPPETRGLALEYTGLSYTAPGRVRFQYRLEGLDEDWVQADDRRIANYANLRPGRYRFQVIASNADGLWNDRGASVTIMQKAHLYEEAWIPWAGGLTLTALVAGAFRWRTAAHARERRRLEAGIAKRTHELQIAKDHAEASTHAKEEFLESISHEIRNPLNGIIGLVALLREAPLDARERELAQSLGACAKGLARVFDEVLNFARLEHGHVTVREKPFSLGALLDELTALFRLAARQRGSAIVVRCEGEVPDHWLGDGEKIKSILGNFMDNALKYAPGSPVEILVECDGVDEFGADVTFNVTDRGRGIPSEEQERIFEKFVRGSTARTQRARGTGLGLATCRALSEAMGGHVAVESPSPLPDPVQSIADGHREPARGSTFFLRLHLKRDRHPTPESEPAAVTLPVPAMSGRALIVEDQPYNQIVVRRIAEQLGFVSDVASDAATALSQLARQPYAVVFVDWELPDMSGAELTRRLRARPGGGEAIVIASTAHDSDEIRRQAMAAGMDGFATKPFDAETIVRLLDDVRARRRAPAASRATRLDTRVFRFVGYDDPEQAGQAARLYLDILDQEVAMLEGALSEHDQAGASAAAHRIKSHAGLVDASELRETADRLQREARSAPGLELAGLREDLIRHAGSLRERLKSWRDEDADE